MNILQLESSLEWGGCEKRCLQEVTWLRRHGHNAWIACEPKGKFSKMTDSEAQPWLLPVHFGCSVNVTAVGELFRIVRKKKVQVVHSHEAIDSSLALPLYWAGIPLVRSRHWMINRHPNWGKKNFFQHSCNKLIATSKEILETFRDNYQIPSNKLVMIGEGADSPPSVEEISRLRDHFRKTWGIPAEAPVFGIIGIIRGEKGHFSFLEAAFRILQQQSNAYFVIVGEGAMERTLELRCIDMLRQKSREFPGIHTRIILTGFYQDIHEPYCGIDVIVIPSSSEGQSKVGPEALMHGKAVIASRVGGLPEIIENEKTGLLIPPNNVDALYSAMLSLAKDNSLRQKLARQGRDYAQAHLRFDLRMEELLSCYESCIKK
jgi:glycosyltransferase involved in cell wall biosynthesis